MNMNSLFAIGITLLLTGIDLIFKIFPHPIGSKMYFSENGGLYMGSFFFIVGTIMILSQFTSKKKD